MKINLNGKQFRDLVSLVYLGGTVAAASEGEDQSYAKIEDYLLSFAKEFGMKDLVEYDEDEKAFYPSEALERQMEPLLKAYGPVAALEALPEQLTVRDLIAQFGAEAVQKMAAPEILAAYKQTLAKYAAEIEKNGLANIKLVEPPAA